jgi:hypothetical protein
MPQIINGKQMAQRNITVMIWKIRDKFIVILDFCQMLGALAGGASNWLRQ